MPNVALFVLAAVALVVVLGPNLVYLGIRTLRGGDETGPAPRVNYHLCDKTGGLNASPSAKSHH